MYRLPGLSLRAAELAVGLVTEEFPDWTPKIGRQPKLDVVGALRLCLCWLRRNMTFGELGEPVLDRRADTGSTSTSVSGTQSRSFSVRSGKRTTTIAFGPAVG